jgi:hypothetical protein
MKWLLGILGIASAGFMGYIAEPSMRPSLTGTGGAPPRVVTLAPEPAGSPDGFATTRPDPVPVPEPTPLPVVPEPTPDPVAAVDPMETPPTPEPVEVVEPVEPEMVEVPEIEPEPTPAPEPAPPAGNPADVVAVMQASIKGGEIKEFTFQQVQGWKAGEDEVVDGDTVQTGLVTYSAETVFGVRKIEAKAFIKGGKVERWIWPKSGLEIK